MNKGTKQLVAVALLLCVSAVHVCGRGRTVTKREAARASSSRIKTLPSGERFIYDPETEDHLFAESHAQTESVETHFVSRPVASADPGEIVQVTSNSVQVGVLLDEMPGDVRDRFARDILSKDDGWWQKRAALQFKFTLYKLQFRYAFFAEGSGKNQLLLPATDEAIQVRFISAPARRTHQGHDVISRTYTISTTLVGKTGTIALSDPNLAQINGSTVMNFWLPLDPTLVLQRTGYACMDEDQFPRNSVDAETPEVYYDDTCTAGPAAAPDQACIFADVGCHCTAGSDYDCPSALQKFVVKVRMTLAYTRVPWDEEIANNAEVFNNYALDPSKSGADLVGYVEGLQHNFIIYKYFAAGSCETKECISGHGWRKLLIFDGIHVNVGSTELSIGAIDYTKFNESSFDQAKYHNSYYWDGCHQHPHFSQYSNYFYDDLLGHKQGFCIQDTNRIINSRDVSYYSPHSVCTNQGISTGWADNYNGGIPCQWVDITEQNTTSGPVTRNLKMVGNPENWLCEGQVQRNADGSPQWESTGSVTTHPPWPQAGLPIDKFKCSGSTGALDNNIDTTPVVDPRPGQGLLTSTCIDVGHNFGPKRDCEFVPRTMVNPCTPGATVSLSVTLPRTSNSQVLRVCESSAGLHTGTACRFNDAFTLANVVIKPGTTQAITFTCPAARDNDQETGGFYSIYSGAVYNGRDAAESFTWSTRGAGTSPLEDLAKASESSGPSTGLTVGLIVAGVAGAALIAAIVVVGRRRQRAQQVESQAHRGSVSVSRSSISVSEAQPSRVFTSSVVQMSGSGWKVVDHSNEAPSNEEASQA